MPKPQNIRELRDCLLGAFERLETDPRAIETVAHQVKAAAVVVASLKCELEYASMRKDDAYIPFLHYAERDSKTIEHPTEKGHRLLKQIHNEIDPNLPPSEI